MTRNAKFTPGPWRVAGKASGYIFAPDGDGTVQIGVVGSYHDHELLPFNRDRWDADARLIAAAPDLLKAAMAAKKYLEPDLVEPGRTVFWNLVAAINKALG